MEEEIWKTIPISLNYEASSHGHIRRTKTGHILKTCKTEKGYMTVGIKGTNKENITSFVHRLVAITFIPNPENKPTVDHKTPDPSNNNVSNLTWSTYVEQAANRRNRVLTTQENPSTDTWGKRHIWKCDAKTSDRIELFETVRDAACAMKSSLHGMSQIFNVAENHEISTSIPGSRQGRPTAMGFKWEFDELRILNTEDWCHVEPADAKGADGFQISTLGRLEDRKGNIRSPCIGGYATHSIQQKKIKAHLLVALTFLERVAGKNFVNHIDGNKNNPVLENLEFVTQSENAQHAHDTGLIQRPETKRVHQFDLEGKFVREFESAEKAKAGVGAHNISNSIRHGSSSGGYLWRHPSEDNERVVKRKKPSHKHRAVKQFDMNGVFLRDYDSVSEAQKEVPGLQKRAAYTRGSSAGYRWKYADDLAPFKKKTRISRTPINQYDLDRNLVQEHKSVYSVKKDYPDVARAARNSSIYKGFRWKFATDTTPLAPHFKRSYDEIKKRVNQFDLNMIFIQQHESVAIAQGLTGGSVSWSVKYSKPSKGFYWKYA